MANITGDSRANELYGTNVDDVIRGLGGNDELEGRGGNDRLYGGKGNDEIDGGRGDDLLFGGKGADIFKFDSRDGDDTIGDFQNGVDRIEFDIDRLGFNDLTIQNNANGDAVITWNDPAGSSITLTGVDASSLDRSDFIFDH